MGDFSMGALLQLEQARLEAQPTQERNLGETNNQVNQQQTQEPPKLQQQKLNAAYAKVAQQLFKK